MTAIFVDHRPLFKCDVRSSAQPKNRVVAEPKWVNRQGLQGSSVLWFCRCHRRNNMSTVLLHGQRGAFRIQLHRWQLSMDFSDGVC